MEFEHKIGKKPVAIPAGVEVKVEKNGVINFKKGNTTKVLDTLDGVNVEVKDNELIFATKSELKVDRALWGTYRSLAQNIIIGLTEGFKKELEVNGVGYIYCVYMCRLIHLFRNRRSF